MVDYFTGMCSIGACNVLLLVYIPSSNTNLSNVTFKNIALLIYYIFAVKNLFKVLRR